MRSYKTSLLSRIAISIALSCAMALALFDATVSTDKNKYAVGETMVVSGTGFTPGQAVTVSVLRPDQTTEYVPNVIASSSGSFSAQYTPSAPLVPGRYKITATDGTNTANTAATEADAAAANEDQCRNGSATSPNNCVDLPGGGSGWANGDVGQSQGHLVEGWSIPYRMTFTDTTPGTWTVDLGYDVVHSGKHSIDFLTHYNRLDDPSHSFIFGHSPECVEPPDGVGTLGGTTAVCGDALAATSTFAIPKPDLPNLNGTPPPLCTTGTSAGDPTAGNTSCPGTSFDAIQASGNEYFSMWGGTINSVQYVYQAQGPGDLETRIRVVFTSTAADGNVVLGWGGHIAREQDWGIGNSAGGISGSPYHMRLKGFCSGTAPFGPKQDPLCDAGGNQDRALAAAVVFVPPLLTLVKIVTNDNGGTAQPTDWTLTATGPVTISGATGSTAVTSAIVQAGTYALSESGGSSAYTASSYSCVKNGGGAVSGNSITLVNGDSATCTINNNDNAPALHLRKVVNNNHGGTATVADFTLSATGTSTPLSGTSPVDSGATFKVGTYTLSETPDAAATGKYSASDWICVGGTQSGSTITLALGDSATCTITNSDIAAHLKLVKTVTSDNGGTAQSSNWTLSAAGPTPLSGSGGAESDVSAGSYTLSESGGPSGYTAGNWSCTGGTFTAPATIAVVLGQSATCTINNNDNAPILHLRKVVVNDNGGTAVNTDWTLTANGGAAGTLTGTTPVDSGASFQAGTYALSESGPTGYTASAWVCVGGTQSGSNITVALGQEATCTITNNDNPPILHLRKVVVNDNGGTAQATDWTLTANGGAAGTLTGTTPVDSGANFKAGTYALSESGPSGYTASAWSCVGGTQSGSNITVGAGQEATCTITNNDTPPILHLRKVVINDNGGTAQATDWTLTANGGAAGTLSGTTPVDSTATFKIGTYALSESGPSGYTASAWSCTGGTQSGSNITVTLGQEATCTITNNDNPPVLHLRKIVVNDNGGTAQATDWTLTANGGAAGTLSGTTPVDSTATFQIGTYALSESGPSGYTASAWSCTGGTQSGSNITVALGQEATCTITNNDNPPVLHLRKTVINDNGGTAQATDWTLTANGGAAGTLSGTTPVDSTATFKIGTYALSESGPSGYTASAWACTGGTQSGSNITVALGQEATCTITNNDNPPVLHLRKTVINDNGGTAQATDWTLTANGGAAGTLSGTTPVDSTATFKIGTYALSESGPSGYTASAWSCVGGSQSGSNITVGLGQEATCTITNNDNPPILHLRKIVINDNGGTAQPADWTLTANGGAGTLSGTTPVDSTATFKMGTYALSESGPSGYTASAWSCVGGSQSGSNITVGLGQEATCTITNNDNLPALHLRKIVSNTHGGTATMADFTLSAAGTTPLSGTSPVDSGPTFAAGTYTLSETPDAAAAGKYTASAWSCVGGSQSGSSITVGLGQSATCTITNSDLPAHLTLAKTVINSHGGTALATNFTLNAVGPTSITGVNNAAAVTNAAVNAGTYSLSESSLYGYTLQTLLCVGGTQNGASISLTNGQSATCTFTNVDVGGTIIIQKNADPPSGVFTFNTTGSGYTGFTINGGPTTGQQNKQSGLSVGTYTVQEATQLGWILTAIGSGTSTSCTVTGSGGSTGTGDVNSQTATINLQNGDTVTCIFENTGNGATRTQGFWATHSQLANLAWFGGTGYGHTFPGVANVPGIGDTSLCGRSLDLSDVMGGFWSSISQTSTNKKRSSLDQNRMQLLQQLLAAELNASAFGSAPVSGTFASWEGAYCGTNTNNIQTAQQQAGAFNSAGDSSTFTPGTAADSKTGRAIANIPFWDILP